MAGMRYDVQVQGREVQGHMVDVHANDFGVNMVFDDSWIFVRGR